jgi:hypothetical protein
LTPPLTVSAVLSDGLDVYRLLFRRSVPIALGIYALINAVDLVNANVAGDLGVGLSVIGIVLSLAGPILVQGALVKIVQSVHEGTRPQSALSLLRDAGDRIGSLFGASLIYSLGVVVGLILLVVPGLLAAARWSLMRRRSCSRDIGRCPLESVRAGSFEARSAVSATAPGSHWASSS